MPRASNASRAIIASKKNTALLELCIARIAELTVAKHGINDIIRILKSESIDLPRATILRIQQELRDQWRTRAEIATDQLVSEELAALDALQSSIWGAAIGGDLPTIDRLMKILEHRAKLLGLFAPTEHRVRAQISTVKVYMGVEVEAI